MRAALGISDLLFGCWHRQLSFPFSPRPGAPRPVAAHETGTYVVCLKCGKQFPFDWEQMCIVKSRRDKTYAHAVEAKSHI